MKIAVLWGESVITTFGPNFMKVFLTSWIYKQRPKHTDLALEKVFAIQLKKEKDNLSNSEKLVFESHWIQKKEQPTQAPCVCSWPKKWLNLRAQFSKTTKS